MENTKKKIQPILKTERLILRPFRVEDAHDVRRLAGDYEIAKTTLNIPHPYEDGMAEAWINTHKQLFEHGIEVIFAITDKQKKHLIGSISLHEIKREYDTAEMGYWIGKPYWNNGYCTEAGGAILEYGFNMLKLNRIYAFHFNTNPASGKVLQKIGMTHEGCLRQDIKKWGEYLDLEVYGILKEDFIKRKPSVK